MSDNREKATRGRATGILAHPVKGAPVTSSLNPARRHPIHGDIRPHNGTDFGAPYGTPVGAADGGTVTFAGNAGGGGKTVVVDHHNGFATLYMHLQDIGVTVGQPLAQGERLGTVGSTGSSTGPHLHFELRAGGDMTRPFRGNSAGARPQDPERFLGKPYADTLVLRPGDRGSVVGDLQTRLSDAGFLAPEAASSRYDSATRAAVERFQRARGLDPDGLVGPDTRRALAEPPTLASDRVSGPSSELPQPSSPFAGVPSDNKRLEENPLERQLADLPRPIRDALLRSLPGGSQVVVVLQAKAAWEALPAWVQDTAIAMAPLSDGVELLRQAYNGATGRGVDPTIVTLSTLGLAGDLGWLDGFVVDPLDFLNGGAAAAKVAYQQMDAPAREVFATVLRKSLVESTDPGAGIAKFSQRLGDLLPHADEIAAHPNAMARLLNLDDGAFTKALRDRASLDAAIRRSDLVDRLVGKAPPQLGTPEGDAFARIYTSDGKGIFKSSTPGYPDLRHENGALEEIARGVRASRDLQAPSNWRDRGVALAGDAVGSLKRQWDALPEWAQRRSFKVLPFGNGLKVLREGYHGLTGRGTNAAKATIYALKQAAKLGWLEPSGAPTRLLSGIELLKDTRDRLPEGPARNDLDAILAGTHDDARATVRLVRRLERLVPHAEALAQTPHALPALLALDEAAFAQAIEASLPEALLAPFGNREILRVGRTGPEVTQARDLFRSLGYESGARHDGTFDLSLEAATRQFQQENDLRVDGIIGPETWQALSATHLAERMRRSIGDRISIRGDPQLHPSEVGDRQESHAADPHLCKPPLAPEQRPTSSSLTESNMSSSVKIGRVTESDRHNLAKSVSVEEFLGFIEGKTFDELITRRETKLGIEFGYAFQEEPASQYRYVRDPAHPGRVIDMNHFFAAAMQGGWGEELGFLQEVTQIPRYTDSAFREEDLRSNALGDRFGSEYLDKGKSLHAELGRFLGDRAREAVPLKQQSLFQRPPQAETKIAQELLAELGHFSPEQIDGKFDAGMATGVRAFQKERDLPVTGILDTTTWEVLLAAAGPVSKTPLQQQLTASPEQPEQLPQLSRGSGGPEVVRLQERLLHLGYDIGEPDGKFGPKTEAGVKAYQRDRGLVDDGIVGPQTWQTLSAGTPERQQAAAATLPAPVPVAAGVATPAASATIDPLTTAETALGSQLWIAATQGFSKAGTPELKLEGSQENDRILIRGDAASQQISGISESGEPLFSLQLQGEDEALSVSIADLDAARLALERMDGTLTLAAERAEPDLELEA